MKWTSRIFQPIVYGPAADTGLMVMMLGFGLLMMGHGWSKLQKYNEYAEGFFDFLGLGGAFSLVLTIFAELFCSFFLVLGMGTRLILIPLLILTVVIAFVIHGPDPFSDKEHALLFMCAYMSLLLTGPGKYSMDYFLFSGKNQEADSWTRK